MKRLLTKIIGKTLTLFLLAALMCGMTSCVSFKVVTESYVVYDGKYEINHDKEYESERQETSLVPSTTTRTQAEPASYLGEPLNGPYNVVRVIDGDTIVVNIDGDNIHVRFIGIDTPESVSPNEEENTPEGEIATQRTMQILQDGNNQVYLEYDNEQYDAYGRLLAYVYIYDEYGFYLSPNSYVMVEEILLNQGMGEFIVIEPNNRYEEFLSSIAPIPSETSEEEQ